MEVPVVVDRHLECNSWETGDGPCEAEVTSLNMADGGELCPWITWIFFFHPHLDYPPCRQPLCNNDDVDEYGLIEK